MPFIYTKFSVGIFTGEEGKKFYFFYGNSTKAISNAFPQKYKPVPNNYMHTVKTLLMHLQKLILQTMSICRQLIPQKVNTPLDSTNLYDYAFLCFETHF